MGFKSCSWISYEFRDYPHRLTVNYPGLKYNYIMSELKAGFVNLLGRTNVGKSTFINGIVGEKVSITSEKPQTTRNRIRCIFENDGAQLVFLDTPGLHKPAGALGKHLVEEARKGLKGGDVLVYMVEPWGEIPKEDRNFLRKFETVQGPKILLVNKVDIYSPPEIAETLSAYEEKGIFDEFIPISALTGDGVGIALDKMVEFAPPGERLFPEGTTTDKPLSYLVSEYVREKVFKLTYEEVPYSVATKTRYMTERQDEDLTEIGVDIYVVRESQKGIIIGENGEMIKKIGVRARKDLEKMIGTKIYLDLKVKVSKNWNRKKNEIEKLGGS